MRRMHHRPHLDDATSGIGRSRAPVSDPAFMLCCRRRAGPEVGAPVAVSRWPRTIDREETGLSRAAERVDHNFMGWPRASTADVERINQKFVPRRSPVLRPATTRPPLFGSNTRQATARLVLSVALAVGDGMLMVEVKPSSNWIDPERTLGDTSRVKPMGTLLPATRTELPENIPALVPEADWARGLLTSETSGVVVRRWRRLLNSAGERI